MVFTSCWTVVSVLPIVATLCRHTVETFRLVIRLVQWVEFENLCHYVTFTFWSSSTVVGRLIKSAADFKLAFKWFTAESSKLICKNKIKKLTKNLSFLVTFYSTQCKASKVVKQGCSAICTGHLFSSYIFTIRQPKKHIAYFLLINTLSAVVIH